MLRTCSLPIVFAAIASVGCAAAANAEGYTTRIEPRPFYGAVVTLEEGVRVIRPLPPERQVIINPNNTPLTLGFNESHIYENQRIYNSTSGGGYVNDSGVPVYGAPAYWPGYRNRGFVRGFPGNRATGHHGRVGGF